MHAPRLQKLAIGAVLALLASAFLGCGGDDPAAPGGGNPGSFLGVWVCYNALDNGQAEPGGGTYGSGGDVMTISADGTGAIVDVDTTSVDAFTWTGDAQTITAVFSFGTQVATYTLTENHLSLVVMDGSTPFTTFWVRNGGAAALLATWDAVSVVNEALNEAVPQDPFAYSFSANGIVTYSSGQMSDTAAYRVQGARVFIGPAATPFEVDVFAVKGNTLYLFRHDDGAPPQPTGADIITTFVKR